MNWLNLVHSTRLYYLTFQLQDTHTLSHTEAAPELTVQNQICTFGRSDNAIVHAPSSAFAPSSLLESSTDLVSCSYLACKCEAVPVVVPPPPFSLLADGVSSLGSAQPTSYFAYKLLFFMFFPAAFLLPACRAEGLQNNLNVSLDCEICFSRCLIVAQHKIFMIKLKVWHFSLVLYFIFQEFHA